MTVRSTASLFLKLLLSLLLLSAVAVTGLRWFDPPTSSFMLQQRVGSLLHGDKPAPLHHEWVPWEAIPAAVPLAVLAAEDQRFPTHHGFDLVEIRNALQDHWRGERLRGASTITQQLAKNLFLWEGRSFLRKGLEAWFTLLLELVLPKRRILELYLNLAQFSADTYGVGAASWRYFDRPPAALTVKEASLLAAVLPNPRVLKLDKPGSHVKKRAARIREQARQLGVAYIERL